MTSEVVAYVGHGVRAGPPNDRGGFDPSHRAAAPVQAFLLLILSTSVEIGTCGGSGQQHGPLSPAPTALRPDPDSSLPDPLWLRSLPA